MHGLAATFGIGGINGDLVDAARLQIVDGESRHLAGLVVDGRRAAFARSGLAVHLHCELLRQTAVEALYTLHVDRVGRLVQQRAVMRRVRAAC